jgi:hypothetical protein
MSICGDLLAVLVTLCVSNKEQKNEESADRCGRKERKFGRKVFGLARSRLLRQETFLTFYKAFEEEWKGM